MAAETYRNHSQKKVARRWTVETPDQLKISSDKKCRIVAGLLAVAATCFWDKLTISSCRAAGVPEPLIEEDHGGFRVVFRKDVLNKDWLDAKGLNGRQVSAVLYVKTKGKINNTLYQQINAIGKSVASAELQDLVDRKLLSRVGSTGRGTNYVLFDPAL